MSDYRLEREDGRMDDDLSEDTFCWVCNEPITDTINGEKICLKCLEERG